MRRNPGASGSSGGGLASVWWMWRGLVGAVVFIGVAFAAETHEHGLHPRNHLPNVALGLIALLILVVGIALALIAKVVDRPLDASSTLSLRTSYLRRFFIHVGLGEVPFFLGVAAVAATGHFWLYFVGAACAGVAYVRVAPTAHHLDRIQREIDSRGGQFSIRESLETLPSRSRHSGWN